MDWGAGAGGKERGLVYSCNRRLCTPVGGRDSRLECRPLTVGCGARICTPGHWWRGLSQGAGGMWAFLGALSPVLGFYPFDSQAGLGPPVAQEGSL